MAETDYDIIPYGDSAFLVRFHTYSYSEQVTDNIHALIAALTPSGVWEELVPAYDNLLAVFCPAKTSAINARLALVKTLKYAQTARPETGRLVEIPVCYGGEFGPDMEIIQNSSGLSKNDVITMHSKPVYKVCMMGFVPGFAFLSEAPKPLHHPRHKTPRAMVPAGSVGLANWQTGIYGLESPGGWQIIGRTPLKMFDRDRTEPFHVKAGDQIKFIPINTDKFRELS